MSKLLLKVLVPLATVFVLGVTVVSASGKAYWTISSETVSDHGRWSSYGSSNKKMTNSNYASFNGDALPASFGYYVHLINNKAATRSGTVPLELNHTTRANNNSGKKGYHYYADVRSKKYEPNTTRVKLHFSADYK